MGVMALTCEILYNHPYCCVHFGRFGTLNMKW